jgi:uncharacterized protein Veg
MSLLRKIKIGFVGLCLASGLVNLESRLYAEIYVPRDYATIQAGIDAVEDGDTVLVAPGIYDVNEPITYKGKNITLKSEAGPKDTIIKGNGSRVFTFNSGETNNAVLEGFTIRGGNAIYGGGICCEGSSPTIRYNIITENGPCYGGGIACLGGANPLIKSNVISNNIGSEMGGGVYCEGSRVLILDNIITGNSVYSEKGGGICCWGDCSVIIRGNYIVGNSADEDGGGIFLTNSEAIIENNIIARNRTREDGGAIDSWYSSVYIIGNTIADNSSVYSGSINSFENIKTILLNSIVYANTPTDLSGVQPSQVFYSDISQKGFAGINGNICPDPLFVNPNPDSNTLDNLINTGDFDGAMSYLRKCFSLQQDSPCIDAGDDEYSDPDGTRADIGAIYFDQRNCNRSDLYKDGFINFLDYARFANSWLKTYPGLEGDIYIDNKGDEKDLEILTENWLHGCED